MRVAVKHMVPVWFEVDLKTKKVDKVVVDDENVGTPYEYRVILEGDHEGLYDTTRYPGRKMAKAARSVLSSQDVEWPTWQTGW